MASVLTKRLEVWANAALSFLYPEVCQLCGQEPATPARSFICASCRSEVRFILPPFCPVCGRPFAGEVTAEFPCANCRGLEVGFHWARSAAVARGCVLEAVHRYKYRGQLWYEGFLVELLAQQAGPELRRSEWDCCIPVPLHPVKERERGFNQAHRLACRLSALTGIPVEPRILKRVVPTASQTRLSRNARIENMRRAFALRKNRAVKGWRCLVIDDVFTTGSTTGACARVLRQAGADLVGVWTVARASEDSLPAQGAGVGAS
jgi:competence protein ComFC